MTLPPAVPAEPKRGIPQVPYDHKEGDRVERRFAYAIASALSRAPVRGRQQVTRFRFDRISATDRPVWLIQDVR